MFTKTIFTERLKLEYLSIRKSYIYIYIYVFINMFIQRL